MCGPLVMAIGRHRHRYQYFLGRILSFSFVGMSAGEMGEVATVYLRDYSLGAILTLAFGCGMVVVGVNTLLGGKSVLAEWIGRRFQRLSGNLSMLMLQDRAWPIFLFGLCTVLLPCGQTLIVFSACAISADPWVGLLCGFSLALFTTPSLWIAMHASKWVTKWRGKEDKVLGICGISIGLLAMARGCADIGWIEHLHLAEYWVVY